jgi:hypothetical protein
MKYTEPTTTTMALEWKSSPWLWKRREYLRRLALPHFADFPSFYVRVQAHTFVYTRRACLCVGKRLAFSLRQWNSSTTLAGEKNALRSHKSLRWKLVYNNLLICQGFFASWRRMGTDFCAVSTTSNRCFFRRADIKWNTEHFVAKPFLGCLLLACLLSVFFSIDLVHDQYFLVNWYPKREMQ